jgi:hypothetical protein
MKLLDVKRQFREVFGKMSISELTENKEALLIFEELESLFRMWEGRRL